LLVSLILARREMPPNAFGLHRLYASERLLTFDLVFVAPRQRVLPWWNRPDP
jgi:hypothetical protein